MRKLMRLTIGLVAATALVATGCDSDPEPGKTPADTSGTDTSVQQDSTNGTDTAQPEPDTTTNTDTPTGTDTGPADVPPADPCDPNPCQAKGAECVGNVYTTYTAPGTCTDNGGAPKCEYAVAASDDCGADKVCSAAQGCVAKADPTAYVFSDKASFITKLALPDSTSPCCFDFNGDDTPDNALGKLIDGVSGLIGDSLGPGGVNGLLQSTIEEGTIAILLEYVGLDDAANDAELTINGFYGEDVTQPSVFATNLAGDGQFTASPNSFVAGTATPLIAFGGASIASSVLNAGPAVFTLSIPLGSILLEASVSGTKIEGTVAMHSNGKGLEWTNGKLGGYVMMEDLFGALNGYIEASCGCLGLGGPLVTWIDDNPLNKPKCNKATASTCGTDTCSGGACVKTPEASCTVDTDCPAPDGEDICEQINSFCGAALIFLKADLDTDDNGYNDAMTVGIWVDATAAALTGVTPAAQ